MEGKPVVRINPVVVSAVLLQVVFVVMLIVTFNNFIGTNAGLPMVEVGGLAGGIEDLPEHGKENIEHDIYLALEGNVPDEIIQKRGIDIREGSLIDNYYEGLGLHYVNLIADISEVKQSYKIVIKWMDGQYNDPLYGDVSGVMTGALCLDGAQLIYGDFDCKPYREYIKNDILYTLFMSGVESIGDDVTLVPEYGESEDDFRVKMVFSDCGETQCICKVPSDVEKKTAAAEFTSLIERLGFDADGVSYYFDDCGNAAMWIDETEQWQQREG